MAKSTASGRQSSKAKATTRQVKRRKSATRAASTRTKTAKQAPASAPSKLKVAATLARGAAAGAMAAVVRSVSSGADDQDPVTLLEREHRRFEALLKEGKDTSDRATAARGRVLSSLAREIALHELMEERVLYPALEPHAEARDVVLEGIEEHHVADLLLSELQGLPANDPRWAAKFKVLGESLKHHIKEEERVMFRLARAVLERDELIAIADRMRALRAEHDTGAES